MIALIVIEPGTPRGLLPYAFKLAGLGAREVRSVGHADSLIRLLGSRNCVVVIEAGLLSEARASGAWRTFFSRRSELPVVVTACAHTADSIRDLVAGKDRMLLEDPFDAAAVVAAVRRVYELARASSSTSREEHGSRAALGVARAKAEEPEAAAPGSA